MDSLENMYEQQPGENPGRGGGLLDVSSVSWTQDTLRIKAGNKPTTVYLGYGEPVGRARLYFALYGNAECGIIVVHTHRQRILCTAPRLKLGP